MTENAGVAVVSGAGSGLGREIALELARRGYDLALLGRRQAPLEETLEIAVPCRGIVLPCDVRDGVALERCAEEIRARWGGAEIVVPAAGVASIAPVEQTSADDFANILATNLTGAFLLIRALLPAMKERGRGWIFPLLSVAARRGFPGWSAYCASKWGLAGVVAVAARGAAGDGPADHRALSRGHGHADLGPAPGGLEPRRHGAAPRGRPRPGVRPRRRSLDPGGGGPPRAGGGSAVRKDRSTWLLLLTPLLPLLALLPGGRWALPLLAPLTLYFAFRERVRARNYLGAWGLGMLWAVLLSAGVIALVFWRPEAARDGILNGEPYRQDMFGWIETGAGRENMPSEFIPEHLLHLGVFLLLTWLTGGYLGLSLGAALMAYMSYFVGTYAVASRSAVPGLARRLGALVGGAGDGVRAAGVPVRPAAAGPPDLAVRADGIPADGAGRGRHPDRHRHEVVPGPALRGLAAAARRPGLGSALTLSPEKAPPRPGINARAS